jgi:hypothetical protein
MTTHFFDAGPFFASPGVCLGIALRETDVRRQETEILAALRAGNFGPADCVRPTGFFLRFAGRIYKKQGRMIIRPYTSPGVLSAIARRSPSNLSCFSLCLCVSVVNGLFSLFLRALRALRG